MVKRWQMVFGVGAGLLVAGYSVTSLMGCSTSAPTSSRPAASQLNEGLNILSATDPSFGVSAAYVKAGRVVYLETRVGQLKPEVYRNDSPDEPAYEMDVRAVDQNNATFFAQRGGDNFAEPSWHADVAQARAVGASQADRTLDWAAAQEGAAAFAKALPASFADHAFHLTSFAMAKNPTTDPGLLAKLAAIQVAFPAPAATDQTAYGSYSSSAWTQVYDEKYSMPLVCVFWTCAASHSATYTYVNPNAGAWSLAYNACNHGNCAGGSKMSADCYSWNGSSNVYTSGISESGESTSALTGANDGTGGCQSPYNWDSGVGSHLCNDDAAYELYQTVHGTTAAAGFAITGQSSHCRGDLCGASPSSYSCGANNDSGDWNTPNCGGNNL